MPYIELTHQVDVAIALPVPYLLKT